MHLLSTEPYPGRSEQNAKAQAKWERRHGWATFFVNWGGIYGNGTELILCCPQAHAETLKRIVAQLEASQRAVNDSDVVITRYPSVSELRSQVA